VEGQEQSEIEYECVRCGEKIQLPEAHLNEILGDCDDCGRKTMFRRVDFQFNPIAYFEDGVFRAQWLAREIMKNVDFITFADTDEMYVYNAGIYRQGGGATIKAKAEQVLGKEATTHRVNEVENHIRRSTYMKRQEIEDKIEFLCLKNGVLDIQTRELSPHSPQHIFLNQVPVTYNPDKDCPKIKGFIIQMVPSGDILVIQELFGYCLWRDYSLDKAFLFIGEGSNGKSTLLNLLIRFLSREVVAGVALQDLDRNRFATAELYGKLANVHADLPDRALRHTGKFKMLTGGDLIYAERKFKGHFPFVNYAKLIFSCNKIPETKDDTTAFYRRWIIINFPHKFEGENDDPNVLDKIITEDELSGLLNWALEGLDRVLQNGRFTYSKTTDEIREDYIKKSNPVLAFVEDCLKSDPQGEIPKDVLYRAFCGYCTSVGLPTKANNVFARELLRYITVASGQEHGGRTVWRGIALKEPREGNSVQRRLDHA